DPEGLARPRGRSMRLLPVGPDHVCLGAACEQPASDGFRYRRRDVRQHLPLRDLSAHSRSDQAGGATERTGRLTMRADHLSSSADGSARSSSASGVSRRTFLQAGAAAGGGLLLSLRLPFASGEAEAAGAAGFTPNAFIRIGSDGQIALTMPYVEMGQGTYTSIPMLIAEELEVELKQVWLEHAPPNEKLYGNPWLGGIQATGNSSAVRAAWQPLRQAGATARTMLVSAAAKRWNVDAASCHAQSGEVLHAPTGKRATHGELAADAARVPVPKNVALKRPQDFKLIGTPAKRLDTAGKVNGTAIYGIDVRPPGVKIATLAQSPVLGGRVKRVDDAAAKAVKGVRQIVRLDDAVAVVAEHMGAAKKGLAALKIEWDDGPNAKLTTEAVAGELEKATLNSGAVAQNIGDVDKGHGERRHQGRGDLPPPVSRARDHGADELHGSRAQGRLRNLDRQPGRGARPGGRGEDGRPAVGQGRGPQSSDRRGGRAAAGGRWCRPRRADRAAGRQSRQGRVDARGRYPARHVSAVLVRPNVCRARREGKAGCLEPSLRRLLGYGEMGASVL